MRGLTSVGAAPAENGPQAPTADPYGPWLDGLTQEISAARLTDPPSQILTYRYRQQTVFYRPPYCCDIPGVLYDGTGAVMCYPSGGLGGKGDGQCEDFFRTRSNCALVWRDARAKVSTTNACARERADLPLR